MSDWDVFREAPRRRAYRQEMMKRLAITFVYCGCAILFSLAFVLFIQGYYVIPLILVASGLGSAVAVYENEYDQ